MSDSLVEETGQEPRLACPRCDARVERAQEYCLECGLRLPHDDPTVLERTTVATEAPAWARGWLVPALFGLVVAVAGTGVAIAISNASGEEAAVSTATGGNLTLTETGETLTPPEPTAPGTTGATAPPATTARPPATTARPPATTAPPAVLAWPRDRRGWTIVLLSLPQDGGRARAEARAAEARRRGLRNVGVLNSSNFASLHPGYYVVFTGVFDSQAEAASALPPARAAFATAYQREIVP
ncbi:MAG TPA: hypothetical protein VNT58_03765 [Gaiellaceae bacterium]|nr:hypothetical protein [Gaiellaceae bacterium]